MLGRRRRLALLLLFLTFAIISAVGLGGVARSAATSTVTPTLLVPESGATTGPGSSSSAGGPVLSASFTVNAQELGDFSAQPPVITSPAAIVEEMGTGRVLFARNADVRRPMASTTKIMTCILVLESLKLDKPVVVSEEAAKTIEP
ncbi:MAG: hypothetical protein H5T84_09190, partial [Thermoleophilia bacterium]|nr:hypothetical protein [Thermoleophilia bacterium]